MDTERKQTDEIRARINQIEAETERLVKANAKPEAIYAVRRGVDALYFALERLEKFEAKELTRKARKRETAIERREKRKAGGLCTECGQPTEPGRRRCRACLDRESERRKARKAAKRGETPETSAKAAPEPARPGERINGLMRCGRCGGRRAPGMLLCHACAKAVSENVKKDENRVFRLIDLRGER